MAAPIAVSAILALAFFVYPPPRRRKALRRFTTRFRCGASAHKRATTVKDCVSSGEACQLTATASSCGGHRDTKVSQETIQRGQQVGTVHWMSGDVALAVKGGQLSSTERIGNIAIARQQTPFFSLRAVLMAALLAVDL